MAILAAAAPAIAADEFRWEPDLATAQSAARQSGRLVLIHFGGPWCGPCQMLERNVYSRPGFGRELAADYVGVKVDPRSSAEAKALALKYGISEVPTDVIATPAGQLVVKTPCQNNLADYTATLASIARQVQPERRTSPRPATGPANPPQIAGQGAGGDRLAQRPAEDRYADYYNRQQSVEREPYQPPVRNQPQQTAPQPTAQSASAPADRYADRYGDRYPNRTVEPSAPASQDRYAVDNRYSPAPEKPYGESPANETLAREELADETQELQAKLPPGSPPLALDGYCAVSLYENRQEWQRGDLKWGAVHRGQTYLFASQEAQQKFLANPDRYCPVCKGYDPVLVSDRNEAVPGRRQFGVFYDNRIYLFANEATLERFSQNPRRYQEEIRQAMRQ